MARSWILDEVKRKARELSALAAKEIASVEGGARVAEAVRKVQQGRRVLDDKAGQVLAAMGLATQEDLECVSRKIGQVRKRLVALLDELGG